MIPFKSAIVFFAALTLGVPRARAQQYRLELTEPGGKVATALFRPCDPAAAPASTACGASIERRDFTTSASVAMPTRARSPNGHDSVTVDGSRIRIKTLDGRKPPLMFLRAGDGTPSGIVISPDSRYAFVVVANRSGNPADVVMIELSTQDAVMGLSLETGVRGIAIARE